MVLVELVATYSIAWPSIAAHDTSSWSNSTSAAGACEESSCPRLPKSACLARTDPTPKAAIRSPKTRTIDGILNDCFTAYPLSSSLRSIFSSVSTSIRFLHK